MIVWNFIMILCGFVIGQSIIDLKIGIQCRDKVIIVRSICGIIIGVCGSAISIAEKFGGI